MRSKLVLVVTIVTCPVAPPRLRFRCAKHMDAVLHCITCNHSTFLYIVDRERNYALSLQNEDVLFRAGFRAASSRFLEVGAPTRGKHSDRDQPELDPHLHHRL